MHSWSPLGMTGGRALEAARCPVQACSARRPPCQPVADVNRHPSQVVAMMRPLLPLLHPGAAVILTLKVRAQRIGFLRYWPPRV